MPHDPGAGARPAPAPAPVSVIIGVRDGERYLGAAIESILDQDPPVSEVVVVDDGSSDASADVATAAGPRVRVLRLPPRGIGAGRNSGVAAAQGAFLAFVDADDRWASGALAALLQAFSADPGLDVVFGHVRQFVSPDLAPTAAAQIVPRPGLEPAYLAGGLLVRREALARVGPFREDLVSGDFIDWLLRAREAGLRETVVAQQVLWRRLHATNHGRRRVDARIDYVRLVRNSLDRRRAAARPERT